MGYNDKFITWSLSTLLEFVLSTLLNPNILFKDLSFFENSQSKLATELDNGITDMTVIYNDKNNKFTFSYVSNIDFQFSI